MNQLEKNKLRKQRRALRVRGKLFGTAQRPRVSVNRSNRYVFMQAINDEAGLTVAGISDSVVEQGTKTERAAAAAKLLAEKLKAAGVSAVIFDRGHYRYHGRVKAVAESLREAGLAV